jgi:DNA ligase-1
MSGRAFPPSQRRTLGLGWSTVKQGHLVAFAARRDELERIFRKHSDLGDWAARRWTARPSRNRVAGRVEATPRGHPHRARQREGQTARGAAAPPRPESARFFIKILSGEMRIGLSEGLVEAGHSARLSRSDHDQVKRIHLVTGDIGETGGPVQARRVRRRARSRFSSRVRFMLASPVETAAELRAHGRRRRCGPRRSTTACAASSIARRLGSSSSRATSKRRRRVPRARRNAGAIGHDVLFDGEVLAHRDGRVLRFFELQRRLGRKQVDDGLAR